ncbi:MAG: hypothetical protein ACKO4V_06395 [Planctomycetota bacterium]
MRTAEAIKRANRCDSGQGWTRAFQSGNSRLFARRQLVHAGCNMRDRQPNRL